MPSVCNTCSARWKGRLRGEPPPPAETSRENGRPVRLQISHRNGGTPLLIFVAVPRTVRLRRTRLAGSDRSTRWRKRIPPKPVITTSDRPNSRITMTQRSKVVASDGDVATSSAPWSEGRNWLHQPKRITADHWSYLRLWADCGHGAGTDRQRANPNLLLGEHLTVVVPQGI
jgi:hypothetical protein